MYTVYIALKTYDFETISLLFAAFKNKEFTFVSAYYSVCVSNCNL